MSSVVLNDRTIVYGVNQLSSIDPILKRLFSGFDIPKLNIETNYFWSLCRSIIYQQISGKAAKTISDRFLALSRSGTNIHPREVLDIDIALSIISALANVIVAVVVAMFYYLYLLLIIL